ncbi:SctK family type III secretion system sorting platform protein [Thiolinea disciformis]|uniref:SctK family type III secretion system sorting platform protein n=1 Tax=Thiolinea disciformis TaxID=125614 RepID=UPI000361BD6E|nr:SctK family type III secretion system sorting platform protein [Thiolinea disciformis]
MKTQATDPARKNKLSQLAWEFNFRPDHYTHDSWFEQMPDGQLIKKLVGCHRSADRVVNHLLQRFGLENQVFFNFSNSLTRLALWSGKDLENLVLHTGAVFYHNKVRQVVVREEVQEIHDQLGSDLFLFMQRRAKMMLGKLVFTLELPDALDARSSVIGAGMLCLQEALSDYPPALRKRMMLKLPHEWYVLWKRVAPLSRELKGQNKECAALIQKIAIETRIGVNSNGQIRFD